MMIYRKQMRCIKVIMIVLLIQILLLILMLQTTINTYLKTTTVTAATTTTTITNTSRMKRNHNNNHNHTSSINNHPITINDNDHDHDRVQNNEKNQIMAQLLLLLQEQQQQQQNHDDDDDYDNNNKIYNYNNIGGGIIWNNLQVMTSSSSSDRQQQQHVVTTTNSSESSSNNNQHLYYLLQTTSGILPNGQITVLLGPSGCGKTTFLSSLAQRCIYYVNGTMYQYTTNILQQSKDKDKEENHHNRTTFNVIRLHNIISKRIAWLQQSNQQDDTFFDQLTVYETIQLACYFELPNMLYQQRYIYINETIHQLGLQHIMYRKIGSSTSSSSTTTSSSGRSNIPSFLRISNWFRRNRNNNENVSSSSTGSITGGRISGGERRRLSVALELLSDKELMIADEPTSGLDSTYTSIVLQLLHQLAIIKNIPVICSLHQPRSSLWDVFDNIILMGPNGRICYSGKRIYILNYFEQMGYTLPEHTNPSEFLIDLVSIHPYNITIAQQDEERIQHLYTSFQLYQNKQWNHILNQENDLCMNISYITTDSYKQSLSSSSSSIGSSNNKKNNIITKLLISPLIRFVSRIGALYQRSWRQNIRDVQMNTSRLLISIGNAFLLAGVFPTVRGTIPYINSIADRIALLSFSAINLCMMSYMKTITLFAQERPIVEREHIREQYSALEYLIAKVLSELPIDMIFAVIFAVVLKSCTGLQISIQQLTQVFTLLTTAGASLGFLLGSTASSYQYATTSGVPVLVILMVVGVINPSGVDPTKPKPLLLQYLKRISPFAYAIEALCIGEYSGVQFYASDKGRTGIFSRIKNAPRMGGLAMITTGNEVIKALGMKGQTFDAAMKHLALISFGNLVFSWFGLLWKERHQRRIHSNGRKPKQDPPTKESSSSESCFKNESNPKQSQPLHVPMRVRV